MAMMFESCETCGKVKMCWKYGDGWHCPRCRPLDLSCLSKEQQPIEHERTDEIVCPWCGHEHADSWEFGDGSEMVCGECDNVFVFRKMVTVTYSTQKKESR